MYLLQGVHVKQMMMEPYQISPGFFNQRMREVSLEKSVAVYEDLRYVGILKDDNCSHFLLHDDWCACRPAAALVRRLWRRPSACNPQLNALLYRRPLYWLPPCIYGLRQWLPCTFQAEERS